MTFERYAIYFAPPPGPLAGFGASWLGWDLETGSAAAHPDIPGLPRPVSELTATPRKYGFHGTMKPPFRLAAGCTESDLRRAARALCAALAPATCPGLSLTRLGGFVALRPDGAAEGMANIAARAVEALDGFRAPPTADELTRRRAKGLSPRHEALLAQWGYPYVMDQFRFHMTLTGRLPEHEAEAVIDALDPVLAPFLPRPFVMDTLALVGADETGRFRIVERMNFGG